MQTSFKVTEVCTLVIISQIKKEKLISIKV